MRRRIIAVLLSLSVGVAAMPMPVMAEGGSEVVLEAAPEEAPAEEAPVEEAAPVEEVAPEAEASVVEAAPPTDEVLITDEEAPVVEVETPAVEEAPAEEELVVEEEVTGGEAGQELGADATGLTLNVGDTNIDVGQYGDLESKNVTIPRKASGVTVNFDPFSGGSSAPAVKMTYTFTDTTDPANPVKKTVELLENTDYKVMSGEKSITIVFDKTGRYRNLGDCTVEYNVTQFDIATPSKDHLVVATYDPGIYIYRGQEWYPNNLKVKITATGKEDVELVRGKDYDVISADAVTDLISAGPQHVLIHGTGSYTGDFEPTEQIKYVIEPADVRNNITLQNVVHPLDDPVENDSVMYSKLRSVILDELLRGIYDTLGKRTVNDDCIFFTKVDGVALGDRYSLEDVIKLEAGVHKYTIEIRNYPNYKDGTLSGTYEILPYSSLESIYKAQKIEDALKKLTYDGVDKSSLVQDIIKDGFEEYNNKFGYDRKIMVEAPVMINADEYDVTIKGAADGDKWKDETYPIKVTIRPREMVNPNAMLAAPNYNKMDYITVSAKRQRYVYNSKEDYTDPEVTVKDTGLATGKVATLEEGKDYTVDKKTVDGKLFVYITGINNYKTTKQIGPNPDGVAELICPVTDILTVDLNSSYITARIKDGVDLDYRNGDAIKLDPKDIEVTLTINGVTQPVGLENYYILGYDTGKLDPNEDGNTQDAYAGQTVPGSAGDHTVYIHATTGNKYYSGATKISYTIKGDLFDSVYAFKAGDDKLDNLEVLSQISVPKPDIVHIGSNKGLGYDNYVYNYYKADDVDCENPIDINRGYGVSRDDLISFPSVGEYKLVVTPSEELRQKEGITGYLEKTFNVVPRKLDKKYIQVTCTPNDITWSEKTVSLEDFKLEVKDIGLPVTNVLVKDQDYTVVLDKCDGVGYPVIKITGMGNYDKALTYDKQDNKLHISKRDFERDYADFEVRAIVRNQPYSGGDKIHIDSEDVTVYLQNKKDADDKRIIPAKEYTVDCKPYNAVQGFAYGALVDVTIKAEELNYTGSFSRNQNGNIPIRVTVVDANIGDNTIFAVEGVVDKKYDGSELKQDETKIVLKDLRTGNPVDPKCWKVDHYENNKEIGTAAIILKAVDGTHYTGEARATFRIAERGLNPELVVTPAGGTNVVYDGTAKTKESGAITVTVKDDKGVEVPEGAYTLSYTPDAVNAGVVTVTATANPDSTYAGKATGTFTIKKADNDVTASVVEKEKVEVGKTTKVAVTAKGSGKITYSSSDETVATVSGDGTVTGVKAGTAVITVSVAEDRNYNAKRTTVTVTVTQKVAGKVTASGVKKVFKTKKQSFTISASALGNAPISFKSDNKNITVNATTGKVTVKAGYVGTASITITAAETDGYKKATKTVKVTIVPKATTLKSVTSKNGKITAKWAKKNIATCYQLQYATDKNFTKGKGKVWSKSETATSKTVKKTFEKGKTYYVRIRTCTRTDKSELLYSAWSAAKKVTIK